MDGHPQAGREWDDYLRAELRSHGIDPGTSSEHLERAILSRTRAARWRRWRPAVAAVLIGCVAALIITISLSGWLGSIG
jgi:t-SNARE complex subunit (syntaxin)